MTRRQTNVEETINAQDNSAAPPAAIPLGVDADYTVKFKTRVDPGVENHARQRELEELAALAGEDDSNEPPPDEISAFCHHWQNFAGYPLSIIRLPDPPERRIAGNSYARPCFNLERLGDTTFDPSNLIGTLQFVNHNSGGVFRVWLSDYNGAAIPGARVERVAIGDPPQSKPALSPSPLLPVSPSPVPPPPIRSAAEIELETVKNNLFSKALERALNPPTATPATGATPTLPPDQQAMLYMLGNTDFMGSMFSKLSDLAQQTAGVTKEPTIKERLIDAGLELATRNPAIVDRLSGVVERIVARVLPDPRYDGLPQTQPQQQFQPQSPPLTYQPPAPPPTQAGIGDFDPGLPEAPIDTEQDDEDLMDILDSLVTLLNSDKPLTPNDPVFSELYRRYPLKYRIAIGLIASSPLPEIIEWIKETGGPLYVSLLDGPASGPFLRDRLAQLQQLIIEAKNNAQAKQQQAATTTEAPASPANPITPNA